MRKYRVFIFLAIGLLIITLVLTILPGRLRPSPKKTCLTFIDFVKAGDSESTYKMFSENGERTSMSDWQLTVAKLQPYYQGKPVFISSGPTSPQAADHSSTKVVYRLNKSEISCYIVTSTGNSFVIDSFISKPITN